MRPNTDKQPATPATPATDHDDLRSVEAGLDRLQTIGTDRVRPWQRFTTSVLPPVLCVVALIAIWQIWIVIVQPRPDLAPGPLTVLGAIGDAWESGKLQQAVGTSLARGILGFLIAVVIGTPLGMLLAEVRPLRRALGPLISGLQVAVPVTGVGYARLNAGAAYEEARRRADPRGPGPHYRCRCPAERRPDSVRAGRRTDRPGRDRCRSAQ